MKLFEHLQSFMFPNKSNLSTPAPMLSSPLFAVLIGLWTFLTFSSLAAAPLFDFDEAAYAQTAAEMMREGKWLLPTMNGQPFYDKPAVFYYFLMASFTFFGENTFAARFTSAVFTLATAFFLYYFGRRLDRSELGKTAALVYLSMLIPALLGHAAIFDALLNFWITASILSFYLWRMNKKNSDAILSLFAAGFAVSIKGPAGAVIPCLIIVLDRLAAKDLSLTVRLFPWKLAVPAFFASALPWYMLVSIRYGLTFLKDFILVHNVHRFAHPMEGHSGAWYYYFLVLIPCALPWITWFPWWVKETVSRWMKQDNGDWISRLTLLWTTAVIVLFSLAQTKLPHYTSSIYPAVALGISAQWLRQTPERPWIRTAMFILVILSTPVALFLIALPNLYPHAAGMMRHPRAIAVVTQGIKPGTWTPAAGAIILLSLMPLAWHMMKSRNNKMFISLILFGFLLQTSLVWSLAPWTGRIMQGQKMNIAYAIRSIPSSGPVYSLLNAPSISFYSRRSYKQIDVDNIKRMISPASYMLIARASDLPELSLLPPFSIVLRTKDFVLLNRDASR